MSCNGETNNGNQQYQTTIHSRMTDNAQNQNRRIYFKTESQAMISNRITDNILQLKEVIDLVNGFKCRKFPGNDNLINEYFKHVR